MKKNTSLILGLSILPLGLSAQSVIESFNYSTGALGSTAASGTGLTGNWAFSNTSGASLSGAAGGSVVNNWSYTAPANYAFTPSGNQFSITGSNAYAAFSSPIATNVSGTYYISFFLQLSQAGNVASSYANVGLMSTQTNNADYLNFGKGSTSTTYGLKFGLDVLENSTTSITTDATFVVLRLVIDGASGVNDSLSFKLYSGSDTLPLLAPETWDFTSTADLAGSFTGLGLRTGSAQTMRVDEIRLGTTWSQVAAIPEPSAFAALAGLGALGLAATRRRRA
jgi:hypothetical protein